MADEVKDGAIGAAIAGGEEPGRMKQFFTDPKNLATMLVLGTALAQNRRGQSFGAHLGRAGLGALGFRGGLDKEIANREAAETEAESVQDRRAAQTQSERDRTAATNRQTDVLSGHYENLDENADEDRASRERIARINRTEIQPPKRTLDNVYADIRKEYADLQTAWMASGQYGPPPDLNAIAARHMQLWQAEQAGATITFEPDAQETTVPEPGNVPDRTISASVRSRALRSSETIELLGLEPGAQMTTQDVDAAINNYDREMRRKAEAGELTPEEARSIRMGPYRFLLVNPATRSALQRVEESASNAITIPTAEQLEERRQQENSQAQQNAREAAARGGPL